MEETRTMPRRGAKQQGQRPCAAEVHADDCPRFVDHHVDPWQLIGPDQLISVQCRAARIRASSEEKAQRDIDKLYQRYSDAQAAEAQQESGI